MNSSSPSIPANILLEHGSFVRNLAYSLLRDEQLAEDASQETWMRWMQSPPREMGRTRGWLATVVRGIALTRASSGRARRERELAHSGRQESADPSQELEQAELLKAMVEGVIELEEPLQSTILLTYFRGWSTRRIAQEQSVSASTVSQRLKRGLHQLRSKLDREHGGAREHWAAAMGSVAGRYATGAAVAPTLPTMLGAWLPWAGAALVMVFAVAWQWNRSTGDARPGLDKEVLALAEVPAPVQSLPSDVRTSELEQPSERVPGATVPVPGKLRLVGRVLNQAYAELGLKAGPAAHQELRIYVGPDAVMGPPDIRETRQLDGEGGFDLLLEDPGKRPLRVLFAVSGSKEYHPLHHKLILHEAESERMNLDLQRVACGVLAGSVVDGSGVPIPDLALTLHGRFEKNQEMLSCTTDSAGRFRVHPFWLTDSVSVDAPGYSVLKHIGGKLQRGADGQVQSGWSDMTVVVLPGGDLRVRILGSDGKGLQDGHVSVSLHSSEESMLDLPNSFFGGPSRSAKTDAMGVASFTGLWADRRLSLRVSSNQQSFQAERTQGDVLLSTGTPGGSFLVLRKGEVRELRAEWSILYELQGTVLDEQGRPAAEAQVTVFDSGAERAYDKPLATLQSQGNGEFHGSLLCRELSGPLVFVARLHRDRDPSEQVAGLRQLGYAGEPATPEPSGPSEAAVMLEVPLDHAVEGVFQVTLRLAQTFALAGQVRTADGEAPAAGFGGARLWVAPAGSGSHFKEVAVGSAQSSTQDGTFRFAGLPAGNYDLYVSREMGGFYSYSSFLHCFQGLRAGQEHLDLLWPEPDKVQIKVRIHGAQAEHMTVLHGRYFPHDPATYPQTRAPELQSVRSLANWPVEAPTNFAGISGGRGKEATATLGLYGTKDLQDHDLPVMGTGWYSIGVNLQNAGDGPKYFPMATPVQFFEPGSYTIDFYAQETVSVSGVVAGARSIGLAIVEESGDLMPLGVGPGGADRSHVVETNAAGEFKLFAVPLGEWRVRLGAADELRQGEFQREVKVTFHKGMSELKF